MSVGPDANSTRSICIDGSTGTAKQNAVTAWKDGHDASGVDSDTRRAAEIGSEGEMDG